jgi:small subunit ribosomal protein S20
MPVIKSAKKKLKVDRKRGSTNKKALSFIDLIVKKARKTPTQESIKKAFKAIDKGTKTGIFHKNKGARMKSSLAKLIAKKVRPSAQHVTKSTGTKKPKTK